MMSYVAWERSGEGTGTKICKTGVEVEESISIVFVLLIPRRKEPLPRLHRPEAGLAKRFSAQVG